MKDGTSGQINQDILISNQLLPISLLTGVGNQVGEGRVYFLAGGFPTAGYRYLVPIGKQTSCQCGAYETCSSGN
jgi:hypothetical protein